MVSDTSEPQPNRATKTVVPFDGALCSTTCRSMQSPLFAPPTSVVPKALIPWPPTTRAEMGGLATGAASVRLVGSVALLEQPASMTMNNIRWEFDIDASAGCDC